MMWGNRTKIDYNLQYADRYSLVQTYLDNDSIFFYHFASIHHQNNLDVTKVQTFSFELRGFTELCHSLFRYLFYAEFLHSQGAKRYLDNKYSCKYINTWIVFNTWMEIFCRQ